MNNHNNLFIYLILVLAFTIFILLLKESQIINENFNGNLYNWRDLYNNRENLYNKYHNEIFYNFSYFPI